MSICEHMTNPFDTEPGGKNGSKINIQDELIWGLAYRNIKEREKNQPMRPMHSPIDIPFQLCRAKLLGKRKKRKSLSERELSRENKDAESIDNKETLKKRRKEIDKPSLLDRSIMSQNKYMDFLSIPNPKFSDEPKKKKYKRRCELEPCPPRFVQLAVPNKRRVFSNWKDYAHFLPTEMLMRYEEILHTDQNLDPREARYYYKQLDRQKRKELRKKKRLVKKKMKEAEKHTDLEKKIIEDLAQDLVDYIEDEPLFTLNYKQMMLSDGILERLESSNIMKKPSRKTKNHYKKTVIEISDKLAVWIDTLTRFVDVQAIECEEDIPPLSISSLSSEGEEDEGESDYYEYSSEDELRDDQLFGPESGVWEDQGIFEDEKDLLPGIIPGDMPDEGEGEIGLDDIFDGMDVDLLEKLIRILSNCPDEFLSGLVDDNKMPGVTYQDVLDKLKALKEGLSSEKGGKPFMEQVLIDWALRNDPDEVNDELLAKIHEVAGLLDDWLFATKPDKDKTKDDARSKGEGEEGEEGEGVEEGEGEQEGEEEKIEKEGEEDKEGKEGEEGTEGEEGKEGEGEGGEQGEEKPAGEGTEGETKEGDADGQETDDKTTDKEGTLGEGGPEDEAKDTTEDGAKEEGGGLNLPDSSRISNSTDMGDYTPDETDEETPKGGDDFIPEYSGEEGMGGESETYFGVPPKKPEHVPDSSLGEGEEGEEGIDVLYEPTGEGEEGEYDGRPAPKPGVPMPKPGDIGADKDVDGRIIKGHKPSKVFEHSPDTVCCLSLKTWAVWLLEITHNAHNWTQWISTVIQQVREYASIVRGDVKLPSGETKVLHKADWRRFIHETEENVVAWRQYSAHVKDLSNSIIENFHGKPVNCCPKCLEDQLIKNVVVAHDTLQALTEAISCAAYWQRCLDTLVERTSELTTPHKDDKDGQDEDTSSSETGSVDLEELAKEEESGESVYDIEGVYSDSSSTK